MLWVVEFGMTVIANEYAFSYLGIDLGLFSIRKRSHIKLETLLLRVDMMKCKCGEVFVVIADGAFSTKSL